MRKKILFFIVSVAMLPVLNSCKSAEEFAKIEEENAKLKELLTYCQDKTKNSKAVVAASREENDRLLSSLLDLSVVNKNESLKLSSSLDLLNEKQSEIMKLQKAINKKDEANKLIASKLRGVLSNDPDIDINVEKGVVYIAISDKMLFATAGYKVNKKADNILRKIAKVINNYNDIEVMVEGHTDNRPIKNSLFRDNWDLSVKRAASVAQILTKKYHVDPKRLSAAGRSYYDPVSSNKTFTGRSLNRRTKIILLPKLDQFYEIATED